MLKQQMITFKKLILLSFLMLVPVFITASHALMSIGTIANHAFLVIVSIHQEMNAILTVLKELIQMVYQQNAKIVISTVQLAMEI